MPSPPQTIYLLLPLIHGKCVGCNDCHNLHSALNKEMLCQLLCSHCSPISIFHEDSQSDEALYKRLCLANGKPFNGIMKKRLTKLGIDPNKSPEELTTEERSKFARLDFDKSTITWQRVLDTCDRHLRGVTIGKGSKETIQPR